MANKKRKWIVRAPFTLTLCAEVTAPNKQAAIEEANRKCSEIEPQYVGYNSHIERPTLACPLTDCDEGDVWWDQDSFDRAEIFLSEETEVEKID